MNVVHIHLPLASPAPPTGSLFPLKEPSISFQVYKSRFKYEKKHGICLLESRLFVLDDLQFCPSSCKWFFFLMAD